MQHHLHRVLTSLAPVLRVITRWPRVQWVTKTPIHQPVTTPHPHLWHTRYSHLFYVEHFVDFYLHIDCLIYTSYK